MTSDPALDTVTRDQRRWSLTANRLKGGIGAARATALSLAVGGAILETLGAQFHLSHPDYAVVVGYLGAAALAILGVIQQWKLGRERVQAWIIARAASESLKMELFFYRTSAGPYSGQAKGVVLLNRRDAILEKVRSVQKYVVEPTDTQLKLPEALDAEGYRKERIQSQIDYFRRHANDYVKLQGRLGGAQFVLALIAALLGAALTITAKQAYGAWVAVITTCIGSVAAYLLAQRYDQLAITYRATADRLEGINARYDPRNGRLGDLVQRIEDVLLEQNQGWIAGADELMKDSAPKSPTDV
jgi:hypothetical protein